MQFAKFIGSEFVAIARGSDTLHRLDAARVFLLLLPPGFRLFTGSRCVTRALRRLNEYGKTGRVDRRIVAGFFALCAAFACNGAVRDFSPHDDAGNAGASAGEATNAGAAGRKTGVGGSQAQGGLGGAAVSGGTSGATHAGGTSGATHAGGASETAGMPGASEAAGSDDGPPPDPCIGKVCNTPPSQDCSSSTKLKTYDSIGSCVVGECSYASHDIACSCVGDSCTTDPCINVTCAAPPAPICKDTNTLTTSAAAGTCAGGSCNYATSDQACAFGCANGACNPDPCNGVTCNTQQAATCKNVSTKTSYASSGTCGGAGKCTYAATDSACGSNTTCAGAGVCSLCAADTSCGASCTACGSSAPKCKNLGTTSQCVKCLTNADCSGTTSPVCNLATNTCVARPSCVGLSATCGVNGNSDCCAAGVVPGGTFYLNYDGVSSNAMSTAYPATVSNFKLDNYEITVGRFRKFVAAYSQNMIPAGAGKNPNNPSDPGWDTANNALLEATPAALAASVKGGSFRTYNDAPGTALEESRPVNYLGYYEAAAFCIWDGGRLPTEAEWDYAAAGGSEQRVYAWGNTTPGANTLLANWGCYFGGNGTCADVTNIARVGSIPAGNGKWGQSDLTGNLFEYIADRSGGPPSPCIDCEQLTGPYDPGGVRGGCFYESMTSNLINSLRAGIGLTGSTFSGARCAL